ncbi:FecR domain-containing protein [Methylosinus sp. H3A]|nr:FecR domain-containing protein [Methylosinus sp. H3A]
MSPKDQNSARDAAIDWLMRRNEGRLSRREQRAFDAWLAADPAHRAAFGDISEMFGRLTEMRFDRATARASRRRPLAAALGAAAALFLGVAFFDDLSLLIQADVYAGPGGTKSVALPDGSHAQLDARSAIALRYEGGERRVALLAGQAWFEVAPDPARPFVVEASGGTVTALGTAFDVSVEQETTRVTVGEHRVSVASGGRAVTVGEGEQSAYAPGAAALPPSHADLTRATAWRNGSLIFENATLGEVVATLGRYHRGHVFFADPQIATRRVTGVFGANDPVEALREIESALGLRMVALTSYLIVIYS